jgi:hypothetical protein
MSSVHLYYFCDFIFHLVFKMELISLDYLNKESFLVTVDPRIIEKTNFNNSTMN